MNHRRLNTTATPGAAWIPQTHTSPQPSQGGKIWESLFAVVLTSDAATAESITEELVKTAGILRSAVNQFIFPAPENIPVKGGGHVDSHGLGFGHSVWGAFVRVALCQDKSRCAAYRNHTWPLLMVTPPESHKPTPAPLLGYKQRSTKTSEVPQWQSQMDALVQRIIQHHNTSKLVQRAALLPNEWVRIFMPLDLTLKLSS